MKFWKLLIVLLNIISSYITIAQTRDLDAESLIENELKSIAPSYVETFKLATQAMDQGDLRLADSLYSIIYKKLPTFDPVLRRLGSIKNERGFRTEGLNLCEQAVKIKRSFPNLITLASCILSQNTQPTFDDYNYASNLIDEAKLLPGSDEDASIFILEADVALRKQDIAKFRSATKFLQANFDKEIATHYYSAILANYDKDYKKANEEIKIAHDLGLSDEETNAFLTTNMESQEIIGEENSATRNLSVWKFVKILSIIVAIWIGGIVLLYLMGIILSKITIQSIEEQINKDELQSNSRIKKIYKVLINIAGVYYYISLPVLVILAIAIGGGIIFAMLSAGVLVFKIAIVVIVVVVGTVIGLLRSLLVRVKIEEPGRILKESEAPELFILTRTVAKELNTRPIDEIRITAETELAVYELGSWRAKMNDNGKRVLILGVALLKDFQKDDFKAVLAHEYGHFANRDTAGGGVALRVKRDITNYYIALFNSGNATWWNVAFLFLRFYNFVFNSISAGATRLQEVLADNVAAKTYGAEPFRNGLTFVIRRSLEFERLANDEIVEARKYKRSFNNLYELPSIEKSKFDLDKEVQKSLKRKISKEDTHPSPVDRFRYVEGILSKNFQNEIGSVHDYFIQWNELTNEMTSDLDKLLNRSKK